MTWGCPSAFLLFIPWCFAAWRLLRRGRRRAVCFSALSRVPMKTSWRQRLSWISPACLLAGLALSIIASARPQTVLSKAVVSSEAIAISMVVDISGSMEALDLSDFKGARSELKTRLDVVKELFAEFVDERGGDLIGLVTFGGFATTRAPQTLDHKALLHVLESVEIPEQSVANQEELLTAVGDGLAMGCARLEQSSNVVSKIMVLLSDGESNAGIVTTAEATELAKKLGVKVYTIGVGTSGVAPVRVKDRFGRQSIQQMQMSFNPKELSKIAAETGGLYFEVRDREGLKRALDHIDSLEKTEIDQTVYENRDEHYAPWLWSGVILIISAISLAMSVERRIA